MLFRHQRGLRWSRPVPELDAEPLERFHLFAFLNTWMEGDVIATTVRNLFTQGCDRVYVLDDGSPDDTEAAAAGAGATVLPTKPTYVQDEVRLRHEANHAMLRISERMWVDGDRAPVWWLCVDADEFHHGPDGLTVREHLTRLDRRVRTVGCVAFDHWPSTAPAFVAGRHPVETQPLCTPRWLVTCPELHWKHELVRHDVDRPVVFAGNGFHRSASVESPVPEAARPIVVHHVPFREESATRRRLGALNRRRADGTTRLDFNHEMRHRATLLDAVYGGRWDEVPSPNPRANGAAVRPRPWAEVAPPELRAFAPIDPGAGPAGPPGTGP
jgi:hypothetical protein